MLLTDFIVLELGNALSGPGLRKTVPELVADLRSDPDSRIIPASVAFLDRGLELFSRPDNEGPDGLHIVRSYGGGGVERCPTTDHHFEQAGFTALL